MRRREFISTVSAASLVSIAGLQALASNVKHTGNNNMPQRVLGKTGAKVSVISLGGVSGMAEKPTSDFHPAEMAHLALDAGICYFDTAPGYGNNQSELNFGEVLATRRNEVFLATKSHERTYDGTMRSAEESLKRLQTDHIDLLQLHNVHDGEDMSKWDSSDGVLKAFYKLRDEKVIRFIGVTGHESAESMRLAIERFEFDTILTTFNPVPRRLSFEQKVLPLALEKNMGIIAMKVMGGGYGSLAIGNPIKNNPARWYYDEASKQTYAETLIRFALGLPISTAVVGMGSIEQLRVNIAAARDMQPLTQKERRDLMKLLE